MRFTLTTILLPLALSAPVHLDSRASLSDLLPSGQIIPTLPPLGIPEIRTQILGVISDLSGSESPEEGGSRANTYGDALNKYTDFADRLKSVVGADNTAALDVLADRLCIAGAGQGSLCSELFAYAYAWYVAQQKGYTYEFVATALGPNNMKQIGQAINTLCLQPGDNEQAITQGVCQRIGFQTDQLANSIIQENTNEEDVGNSNSLAYFGLQNILPKPAPLGV